MQNISEKMFGQMCAKSAWLQFEQAILMFFSNDHNHHLILTK